MFPTQDIKSASYSILTEWRRKGNALFIQNGDRFIFDAGPDPPVRPQRLAPGPYPWCAARGREAVANELIEKRREQFQIREQNRSQYLKLLQAALADGNTQ